MAMELERAPRRLEYCFFEIVRGCQLKCVACPISGLLPKVEQISVERFERCLRNIDVDSIENFQTFLYGEPLLHDDLPGIFRAIGRQSWSVDRVELSTNGQLVDWAGLEEVFRTGVLTRLVVSCDGDGTPEDYEALRPPSKWSKFREFLARARELRDRTAPQIELMTRTVVPNWDDRARWLELLRPLGWEPEFRHFYYLPDAAENMTGRQPTPGTGACVFVTTVPGLYVDCDGTLIPCCVHPGAGNFGSLLQHKFSELHEGERRAKFVEGLRTKRSSMGACAGCEHGENHDSVASRITFFPEAAALEGLVPPRAPTDRRSRRLPTVPT